jgi:hypothetical protein
LHWCHTNNVNDPVYKKAVSAWLRKTGFDLEDAERKHLLDCMENLAEIEVWRETELTEPERRKLNHPTTIFRKWRAFVHGKAPDKAPAKESMKETIIRLQAKCDRLERERAKDAPFASDDTAHDIADMLFRLLSESKCDDVFKHLRAMRKEAFTKGKAALTK